MVKFISIIAVLFMAISCGDPGANRPRHEDTPDKGTDEVNSLSLGIWTSNLCEPANSILQESRNTELPNISMNTEVGILASSGMYLKETYYTKEDCIEKDAAYSITTYYTLKTPSSVETELPKGVTAIDMHVTDVQIRIINTNTLTLANSEEFLSIKDWELNRGRRAEDVLRNDIRNNTSVKTAKASQVLKQIFTLKEGALYFGVLPNNNSRPVTINEELKYSLLK